MKNSKVTVERSEVQELHTEDFNGERITITVVDNISGETVTHETAGSVMFSAMIKENDDEATLAAGMAGEFSVVSILKTVESLVQTTVIALKEHADLEPDEIVEVMAGITSKVISQSFSKEERVQAAIKAMMTMAEMEAEEDENSEE